MSDYNRAYKNNSKYICLDLNRLEQKMKQSSTRILKCKKIKINLRLILFTAKSFIKERIKS